MLCALTASAFCHVSALQLSDGVSVRVAPAAAVEEGDCMREVVEARTAAAAHVAHSVIQEAAVRPGAYHQLAACTHSLIFLSTLCQRVALPNGPQRFTAARAPEHSNTPFHTHRDRYSV